MPPKSLKENLSPAKPVSATPPRPGVVTFFYPNPGAKTHGLTPNGKTLMPLNRYEGPHHRRVRSEEDPTLIVNGDKPLSAPYKNTFQAEMLLLDAQLINLRERSDHDYDMHKKKKAIDPAHFEACIRKIRENIQQIKICYNLAPDPVIFLAQLNQRITESKAYNPFGLKQIYCRKEGYRIRLAQDPSVFQCPLQQSDIIPPQAAVFAASTAKRPPAVFVGLYDGIEGMEGIHPIDDLGDEGCSQPPRKREPWFFSDMSASTAAVETEPAAQEDPALAAAP